ncbi:MAG TPA: enoyl-CoA hydratase/isomerase family protein [Balneolales bacterium]|nr:enoyl-CoA hydratase/isomerase family protein [Balneolales bacterium]
MPENGEISVTIEKGIATITFYHPKGNSFPGKLLRELADQITSVGKNAIAKVIILQSRGDGAFCAGASFTELINIKNYDEGKKFFMGFALVINAMRKCPKLIIARVQGKAVGGGVGLASSADYALARDTAFVKLSELALGIGPFVVGPAVERKIGTSSFATLAIDAKNWRSAQWAKDKGLFTQIYASTEDLDSALQELAQSLADSSPDAMAELKRVLWEGTENWDDLLEKRAEISGRLVLSDYTRDFITKFKEKH